MPAKGTRHSVLGWQGRAQSGTLVIAHHANTPLNTQPWIISSKSRIPPPPPPHTPRSIFTKVLATISTLAETQSNGGIAQLSLCLTESWENWTQNFWKKKSLSSERVGSLWKELWVSLSNCKPAERSADTHHTHVKTQTPVILHCCSRRFVYVSTGLLTRLRGQLWQLLQERCCTAGETRQPSRFYNTQPS